MGLLDREWFVEDHKRREKEYGGDFSLHSKKVSGDGDKHGEISPIEQELRRYRKERAEKNKAAIAIGSLTLLYAAICIFGRISPGALLPGLAAITNAYMCVGAENRKKKEGDKTDLNSWARYLTMTSVLAMLWLIFR
jgi:hypothetical protein